MRPKWSLVGMVLLTSFAWAQPPDGRGPESRGRRPPGMMGAQASFDNPSRAKNAREGEILKVLEEIEQTQGRILNVPAADGRLLRLLAEATNAKSVVEFGTSNGISAIWIAMALEKTGGKLVTFEIDKERIDLARKNFAKAGIAQIVTIVEGNAHETAAQLKDPIDMVFIDADKEGYPDYLKRVLPLLRPGGLVLAHNITARVANSEYVKAITTNPDLETTFFMEGAGMSVTVKKR